MSMMPSGMPNMDLNALVRMYSNSTNQANSLPDPNRTYKGVTYDPNHAYVTSGFIANSNREALYKDKLRSLGQEANRAAQTLLATNKKNPKYWSESTGLPSNKGAITSLLGNAGLTPGRLQGGDRFFVDLLPYADRYTQLLQEYKDAGGTNRNYGQRTY